MRSGCSGCLGGLVSLFVGLAILVGAAWAGWAAVRPARVHAPPLTSADGVSAQQKIYEVVRRSTGERPPRSLEPVVLSEREIGAFLSRHLVDATDLPFSAMAVRVVGQDRIEFAGRLPLDILLAETAIAGVMDALPKGWGNRPVWLTLHAKTRVQPSLGSRRHLRLDVDRFYVGRLPLPVVLLRLVASPAALKVLQYPLPSAVEGIRVEPGRVVIRTAS